MERLAVVSDGLTGGDGGANAESAEGTHLASGCQEGGDVQQSFETKVTTKPNTDEDTQGCTSSGKMDAECPSAAANSANCGSEEAVASGSRETQKGNEERLKSIVGDWTVEQLKALHDYIDKRGTEESALAYGAVCVPGRSAVEIHEMVERIRSAIHTERRNRAIAQERLWMSAPVDPLPSSSSEINSWSQAVQAVQTRKRKIQDCTRQAMARFLWHEVSCRPASETTRRLLPVTDSDKHPGSAVHEIVDFCRLYRFLHSCVSHGPIRELKSLEAAVLLSILSDIQEEVDSQEHENKRRVLAGIFRNIQEGKLSEYDFHVSQEWDDIRSVQLDPLNLFGKTRNIFTDYSSSHEL